MIIFTTLSVLFILGSSCAQDFVQKFSQFKIVPDVLSKAPDEKLKVLYDGGKEANFGNELLKKDTQSTPRVEFKGNDNKFYTLSMIDPDAPYPDNPTLAQYLHWLVINIPGDDVSKGEVKASYMGPAPPAGPAHRYIVVVYEQPNGEISGVKPYTTKTKFSIEKFAKDNGLKGPIAGNFYLTALSSDSAA